MELYLYGFSVCRSVWQDISDFFLIEKWSCWNWVIILSKVVFLSSIDLNSQIKLHPREVFFISDIAISSLVDLRKDQKKDLLSDSVYRKKFEGVSEEDNKLFSSKDFFGRVVVCLVPTEAHFCNQVDEEDIEWIKLQMPSSEVKKTIQEESYLNLAQLP